MSWKSFSPCVKEMSVCCICPSGPHNLVLYQLMFQEVKSTSECRLGVWSNIFIQSYSNR